MNDVPALVRDYMAKIGARGGAKGKGKKKKRMKAQYSAMGKRSGVARKKK
jgi:hypothetical protein